MENINITSETPIQSFTTSTPPTPQKNIYKVLFFICFFILLAVIIFLYFILSNKTTDKSVNNEQTPVVNSNKTVQSITPTISVPSIKTKIRSYTYKYDSSSKTITKTFPSLTSGSMTQTYVNLILEEEDATSFGSALIKNFLLTISNKQQTESYSGFYTETNGNITLSFENQTMGNYSMPKTETYQISENNIVIDGANLIRNDKEIKVYGYNHNVNGASKIFPSLSGSLDQIYARLILVNEESTPKTFLFTTLNKQEKKVIIGQYSIKSNQIILGYNNSDNSNSSGSFTYDPKSTNIGLNGSVITIDNVELPLLN